MIDILKSPKLNGHLLDTPASLPLCGHLTGNTGAMTPGSNAGIKRNRRPTGTKAIEKKIKLDAQLIAALDEARIASGNLSLSLYLERLAKSLTTDLGGLPVLSPTIDAPEVRHPVAA
jgi:hypothetical protein